MSEPEHAEQDSSQIDTSALQAEVERLRAENERLAIAAAPDARRVRMARNGFAKAFIIVGVLLLGLSIPAVWLNRTVMDTERWVATVGPLASDPAIQELVGVTAADAILERIDVEGYLSDLLPEQLQPLAGPISSSIESVVREQTQNLVVSDQFSEIWVEVVRQSHPIIIRALTGDSGGALTRDAGVVSLDVGVLSDSVLTRLSDRGVPLVDRIPSGVIDRQVVLFESQALASASSGISIMNRLAIWLPWLAVLTVAGAIALAENRRRVVLWLGVGMVVVTLLPLEAIYFGQHTVASAALSLGQLQSEAAQSAYGIIFADLIRATRLFALVGLLVWAGAVVAGPSRWAVALRKGLSGGLSSASASWELGAFGEFVSGHQPGLRAAGLIAIVLVFLAVPVRSLALLIWLLVALGLWLAAIELLGGAQKTAEEAQDSADTA